MNAEYVSLGALAQNMDIYERMPAPLQGALQESVQRTIQASLISIVILTIFHFISRAMQKFHPNEIPSSTR